ncbi:hypothetical protein GP982_24190 [Escherichia coli]|uniref:Uncharacterized protein n=1 Tax=Escherichia coli TaxID=562 RepID=A0A6D0IDM2_ECOLX|nr:hypothetical protein [Escherichia coli]KAE9861938.1 hypothetical protein GP667_24300 [Escherichia coli]MWR16494.1 hypothetical protein [Escherichia coli]MWS16625.1 hypothetical protein [Escherichia coli]HAG7735747.1 hypothetical protein [Escherichia coli]
MPNLANWATNWQKDDRFSRNATKKLIEKACEIDTQLYNAYISGTLVVTAGPHRKAGPNGGGDARWHMTIRPEPGSPSWHIILDDSITRPVSVSKREHLGHQF